MYETILFLDFDGTITAEETLDGVMRRTIDADFYKQKYKEMLAGTITLGQAVREGFATIPCNKLPIMLDYVRSVQIRPGFDALLHEMERQAIPVVVISGGLKPYVVEKLAPYHNRLLGVHSVELDCSGPFMRLASDYEGNGEIMNKTRVMDLYDYQCAVSVGDSYTDLHMAKASQYVFARDKLKALLDKQNVAYTPWNDFFDVLNIMRIRGAGSE